MDSAANETGSAAVLGRMVGPCRVELRTATGMEVLHAGGVYVAHHRSLEPFASYLALGGVTDGTLALVEEATGAVVARRRVAPLHRRGAVA